MELFLPLSFASSDESHHSALLTHKHDKNDKTLTTEAFIID